MKRMMLTCLFIYCVVCLLFMALCRGPQDKMWAYILMVPLGFVMGALYAAQRAHFAAFVPGGVSSLRVTPTHIRTPIQKRYHTGTLRLVPLAFCAHCALHVRASPRERQN